jgi:predicted ATPase
VFLSGARRTAAGEEPDEFPWTLPILRGLTPLRFVRPVTFFVGENGSGKSTLLEALAVASDAVALGGANLREDPTLAAARSLADGLTLSRSGRPRAKSFLRAEDVFGYTQRLAHEMRELGATASDFAGTRAERYGENPDARSHGETFLALLEARLVPAGLYFLDEPETPLSPTRVLALLAMLVDAVASGSQFVIATHSPILMALPEAALWHFDREIRSVDYDDVEHVRVTRDFLNAPARYLRHLLPRRPGADE